MTFKNGIIFFVNKGKLANYFERGYLNYQLEHGRMSQAAFARVLQLSKGYLNQLLEGKRTSMTYHAAVFIADILGDDEILEILSYERSDLAPRKISIDQLSPDLQDRLSRSLEEIQSAISSSGIAPESEEGDTIARSIFEKHGLYITNRTIEDDSSNNS